METTPHGTFDTCKYCCKSIRYDEFDGYWDNLIEYPDGSRLWTPFNCVYANISHEPINHTQDSNGYYYPNKLIDYTDLTTN